MADRVCVGAVVGAHGIKGAVRVKSFTADPTHLGVYGPVEDEAGQRRFKLAVIGEAKGLMIARLDGISDRNTAEALRGTRLYVAKSCLPTTEEDEFLYVELVGCRAEDEAGTNWGTVTAVFDFGAGEVLDIAGPGGGMMLPFTRAAVPVVDIVGRRLVVVPPVYAPDEKDE
jgi:16S rRNA processing protein RimM